MKEAEKNNKIENFRLIIYKIAYLLMIEKKSLLNFYEYILSQGFQRLYKTENFIARLLNNYCIKAKLKGLPPALHRQQALSAA